MIPDFQILANSQDITALIRDRLISIRVTDEAGFKSDNIEITLDNRDGKIAAPKSGAELDVRLGYKETGLVSLGTYTVDEIGIEIAPARLIIPAKAANMKQSLKAPKSRAWHDKTIADMLGTIASEHGLQPKAAESLADIHYPHIDQTEESDLHFLTRLAKQHDAVAKPVMNRLIFVPKGEAKSASGVKLPVIPIAITDLSSGSYRSADRGKYKSVKAFWNDKAGAKKVYEQVGSDEPTFTLRQPFANAEEAQTAAQSKLDAFNRGTATFRFSTYKGRPEIRAEGKINVQIGNDTIDGEWIVTRIIHSFRESGFTSQVEAELPKKQPS